MYFLHAGKAQALNGLFSLDHVLPACRESPDTGPPCGDPAQQQAPGGGHHPDGHGATPLQDPAATPDTHCREARRQAVIQRSVFVFPLMYMALCLAKTPQPLLIHIAEKLADRQLFIGQCVFVFALMDTALRLAKTPQPLQIRIAQKLADRQSFRGQCVFVFTLMDTALCLAKTPQPLQIRIAEKLADRQSFRGLALTYLCVYEKCLYTELISVQIDQNKQMH